jgi:hypothetical protein
MANEWIYTDGAACYNSSSPGFALSQSNIDYGLIYVVQFSIIGMTTGKLIVDGIGGSIEFSQDGDYQLVGIASTNSLKFIGEEDGIGNVFDGCIDGVSVREVPLITIKDLSGNIVFEQTTAAGVSAAGSNIQYQIDWSDLDEGCYKIHFSDGGIDYESDSVNVKTDHFCTLLLTWNNDEDAFGFNYSDVLFTQSLRVYAKKWQPKYTKEKNVFKDNSGARHIIKSEISKEEILTISEMPEYLHDALSIGLEHDNFYVDGQKYVNEENEYTPKWRKSSQLAPVEVVVIKDQNLKNNNC